MNDASEGSVFEEDSTTESESNHAEDDNNNPAKPERVKAHAKAESKPQARKPSARHSRRGKSRISGLRKHLSKQYRDLLNSSIEDVNLRNAPKTDIDPLPPSQIGASFWTTKEKECFFTALSSHGPGDIRSISASVRTKSESEVQTYIMLLEEGVQEVEASSKPSEQFSPVDVPAAHEIHAELESVLDVKAEALRSYVEMAEAQRDEEKFGDRFTVDEDAAAHMEETYATALKRIEHESLERSDNAESRNSPPKEPDSGRRSQAHEQIQEVESYVNLLRPIQFLQLSRDLFMNSSNASDDNFRSLLDISNDTTLTGPAIHHTALEDFHNLAVSLTRRLVQVSIFQAMSRLRAKTDSRIAVAVNDLDVRTALNVLGMRRNQSEYWAKAARRCRVEVYSEKAKFKDGRPTGKNGVKLSYDEVEEELEFPQRQSDQATIDEEKGPTLDDLLNDSDAFTEASTSEVDSKDTDAEESGRDDSDEETSDSEPRTRSSIKRKRARSPCSFEKAEDRYLESLDQNESKTEELRLCSMLHLKPSSEDIQPPEPLGKRPKRDQHAGNWRENVRYQAPWEGFSEPINENEFRMTGEIGRRQKETRMQVYEEVRARLRSEDEGAHEERTDDEEEDHAAETEDEAQEDGTDSDEDEDDEDEDDAESDII